MEKSGKDKGQRACSKKQFVKESGAVAEQRGEKRKRQALSQSDISLASKVLAAAGGLVGVMKNVILRGDEADETDSHRKRSTSERNVCSSPPGPASEPDGKVECDDDVVNLAKPKVASKTKKRRPAAFGRTVDMQEPSAARRDPGSKMQEMQTHHGQGCRRQHVCGLDAVSQLRNKLSELGWRERDVVGDGACQFRAVADQLWGNQERHSEVRRRYVHVCAGAPCTVVHEMSV